MALETSTGGLSFPWNTSQLKMLSYQGKRQVAYIHMEVCKINAQISSEFSIDYASTSVFFTLVRVQN